jgi:hypothetical protein
VEPREDIKEKEEKEKEKEKQKREEKVEMSGIYNFRR